MAEAKRGMRWGEPQFLMLLLSDLRCWRSRQVPVFYFITKTRVFNGLLEGQMCPVSSWSLISWCRIVHFSLFKDHRSSQTGSPMIHSRQGVRYPIAVLRMGVLSISIFWQSFILRHSHSSPLARTTLKSSKPSLPSKLVTMSATRF